MSEDIMNIGFNSLNIDIEGEIYEYLKYNDLLKLVCACTCLPETIILLKNKLYDAKIYDEIEILENLIKQLLDQMDEKFFTSKINKAIFKIIKSLSIEGNTSSV